MLGTVFNIFRIPDLRNKIIFTIAMLMIYRIGFHIAVPGFDQSKITEVTQSRETDSPMARATEYMQMFTGGTLSRSSLFGLGIMPYITSSIILMLKEIASGGTDRPQKDTGIYAIFDCVDMYYSIDYVYENVGRPGINLCRHV